MLAFSLKKMTLIDLVELDRLIKVELARARDRKRAIFKQRLEALVAEFEMSPADVASVFGFKTGRLSRKGIKVAIKYRNPDTPQEAWTGRGRQPLWLAGQIAAGRQIDDFLV